MQCFSSVFCRLAFFSAALLLAGAASSAQSIQVLLTGGEFVPGSAGLLSSVSDLHVADDGQWVARVTIAGTGSTGFVDTVLLNGAVLLSAGDTLLDLAGLEVEAFDEVIIGAGGILFWNIRTNDITASDESLYRNQTLISQESSAVFDPNQPVGTIWKDFDGFDLNDKGDLLVLGDVDSPTVVGSSDAALVLQTFDSSGVLATEDTLILEGDPLPGLIELVEDVGRNSAAHDIALSNDHWIAYVRNDGLSTGDEMVMVDGVIVAQEGASGPLAATTWGRLSANAVDITNSGKYVFRGEYVDLAGNAIKAILVDNLPFLTEGDTSPALSPFAFERFGDSSTSIKLSEAGNVVFRGQTDNPDVSQDGGYFLNDRFLIHEGVTQVGGDVIVSLTVAPNGLQASPNGRYVICQATLSNANVVVLLFDLGLTQVMASGTTAAATLVHSDGLPIPGETTEFQMDGEQDLGVTPLLLVSNAPVPGWTSSGSGVMTPFGEILIDLAGGNPALVLMGSPSDFSPADFSVAIPNSPALVGESFFVQGFYWDIGDQSPAENFRLTNGIEVNIGQ